jgi:hydrophobe/amphiphile efflux-1 (HAE1) family protein
MLEDRAGGDIDSLAQATDQLVAAARTRPELQNVISTFRNTVPQYKVDLDRDKAQTQGIPVTDVYDALQTFLGGLYVNDFNRFGRTWRVYLEAEPEFRRQPSDINRFYVRTGQGDMVPLSTLVKTQSVLGPEVIYRYNRYRAVKILGSAAPGYSSGQAAKAMEDLAKQLPNGFGYEWTGTVYQEKLAEGKEGYTFGLAAILVFLFLAALYESWSTPFAVILAVPLGIFGALLGIFSRNYAYDVYTQIGIVTLIGLAAKNAILIVEFAKLRRDEGMTIEDAALEAAHLRLRPILMTSFAFILGVVPLVIATGAGAGARRALGTTVFSGMLAATILALFIVPILYIVVNRIASRREIGKPVSLTPEPASVGDRD